MHELTLIKNKYWWWPIPIALFCIITSIMVYIGLVSHIESIANALVGLVGL